MSFLLVYGRDAADGRLPRLHAAYAADHAATTAAGAIAATQRLVRTPPDSVGSARTVPERLRRKALPQASTMKEDSGSIIVWERSCAGAHTRHRQNRERRSRHLTARACSHREPPSTVRTHEPRFHPKRLRSQAASNCGQFSALSHISCCQRRALPATSRRDGHKPGVSPLIVDPYLRNAGGNCPRR